MREGMAEIEERAPSCDLPFVFGHDRRLGANARLDRITPRRAVARHERLAMHFAPGEEGRVADKAVFNHLGRSEEHTSELQSLMRISYAVFCLKKKNTTQNNKRPHNQTS